MPSPFPGMDPYLEAGAFWPLFQQTFIACCREVLQSKLADPYQTRVKQRHYNLQDEHHEDYIEIVRRGEEAVVTLLDVVSPANKTTAAGREAFMSTWLTAKNGGANLVEMDFVLQGGPMLDYARDGLPAWDYAVSVMRGSYPERYEIYTSMLNKRLPRIKVPLAATDRDAVLDLPAIFQCCYDRGDFGTRINYQEVPECLHNWIAFRAYCQWQQEGCPHGRDKEHWYATVEQLRRPTGAK
jgi:Protein of unknown function (DUF4058)/Protein of unknown function (DUF2934)